MSATTGPIACCCDNQLYTCCLRLTMSMICQDSVVQGCAVIPVDAPPIEYFAYVSKCVERAEDCNCEDIGNTLPGHVNATIIGCSASFTGYECVGTQPPPVGPDSPEECGPNILPCQAYECGPCSYRPTGCTPGVAGTPCPPPPTCIPDPCCEPAPPTMCCCATVAGGCIVSNECVACPAGAAGAGVSCTEIQDCSLCTNNVGIWIATQCCPSCLDPFCRDWDVPVGTTPEPTLLCGCGDGDCSFGSQEGQKTCTMRQCLMPCPSTPIPDLPLCPCEEPIVIGICGTFTGRLDQDFAEDRYTSGFINTPNGYEINPLFLFGYGNNHL